MQRGVGASAAIALVCRLNSQLHNSDVRGMFATAVWRSLLITAILLLWFQPISAQEDPNGQYVVIAAATLNGETREISAPIEPSVLRLFFNVQTQGEIKWEIISPLGKPALLDGGNVSITEANGKRSVALWDPRPGLWKVRLTGAGMYSLNVISQSEVYACCMNVVGRQLQPQEKVQAARGSRLQANVYVSGSNLEMVNFMLVNEQNEIIAPLRFRQGDFSNPTNFIVLIEVPAQPSRVMVRGREQTGASFQRIYPQLIVPTVTASVTPETTPPVVAPSASAQLEERMSEGDYRIIRAQVSSYTDEMLLTEGGNPVGIRLRYTVRFPVDGYYSPLPNLYPEKIGNGYTGALSMRQIRSSVTPLPEGVTQPQQVLYAGRILYKRDQPYEFTVDLVPNYVIYNEQQKKYCLQSRAFSQGDMRERFEREVKGETRIRYRFSISGTDYDGRQPTLTEKGYAPGVWYASLMKEGVLECQ